ncbi:hypothetical protein B7760_02008 [Burkholderia glumae]|uniref:hypothetical protein n=1 Tax=Burkholderia glumae TaxID=337 RepID=UPI00157B5085|nr:hypothetical protein [Burkholderia glumae]MCR1769074.1 hypothetical protein [Burkholderia glumae]QKM47974.1 hypothetical protein B7760_02008 [Burkholderia glumae]
MNSVAGRSRKGLCVVPLSLALVGEAALLTALIACTSPPPTSPVQVQVETRTKVIDTACNWTKPIYLEKSDVLSDATARAVLAHNQAGAKECGWKPLSAK